MAEGNIMWMAALDRDNGYRWRRRYGWDIAGPYIMGYRYYLPPDPLD